MSGANLVYRYEIIGEGSQIAQHECTSSSVLGGKRSQLCLCCRPTHSPSGSPIRTTSSIRCGAGTVGY